MPCPSLMPCPHGDVPGELPASSSPGWWSSPWGMHSAPRASPVPAGLAGTGRQFGPAGSLLSLWSWHSPIVTNACQLRALEGTYWGGPMSRRHFHAKKGHNYWRSLRAGGVSGQGESPCTCPQGRGHSWGGCPPMPPAQGVPTPWGVRCGVPSIPSSPHSRGQPRLAGPGPLSLLGAWGPSLPGARRVVAGVPMLGPGQQPTSLLHNSSLCKPPAPHWPPLPSHPHRPGDAEGSCPTPPACPHGDGTLAPEHHPGPRASPVQPDHRCQNWTAVRRVPSPRQPPSPSAGCLPVTRRLAMGDFSQLGMKS
ncbi:basic proline-rich protein-like [Chroicocephalus ridibundus]|uniref:basic proline-rich protein-like n=1 Tax=Chroicocephalus ridibundus TaxID=1192867 RepID=UPI002FDD60B0